MAGFGSVPKLAEALAVRGVGGTNLYQIERDERPVSMGQLAEIAWVCGVPIEFFTADFGRLPEISDDPRRVIAEETAAARRRAEMRREERGEDPPARQEEGQGS